MEKRKKPVQKRQWVRRKDVAERRWPKSKSNVQKKREQIKYSKFDKYKKDEFNLEDYMQEII